jgi:glucose-6-phosphate isomerase
MANFVAKDFTSLYDPFKERAGGAYFFTKEGWIKNERCMEAAKLRRIEAPEGKSLHKLGLGKDREMYSLLKEPLLLDYLTIPEEHLDIFKGII